MVDVFITVDTEISTYGPHWSMASMPHDIERDIYGATVEGQFGLQYQIEMLNKHGLKGVFFVEALFACLTGPEPLRKMVQIIQEGGHEVQLHLHTEWLANMAPSLLPGRVGDNMKDFSEEEQFQLITRGIANLRKCGADNLCAFRAGNYGANLDTLSALARSELRYDSSYNECYLNSSCGMRGADQLVQPRMMNGVVEFPISYFRDLPGHFRHMQLCACSSQEMEHALRAAWKQQWSSLVIVSHSFELIRRAGRGEPTLPDWTVIRRFERLCRFLADNRDKFRTAAFSQLDPDAIVPAGPSVPISSRLHFTAFRWSQQLFRRLLHPARRRHAAGGAMEVPWGSSYPAPGK